MKALVDIPLSTNRVRHVCEVYVTCWCKRCEGSDDSSKQNESLSLKGNSMFCTCSLDVSNSCCLGVGKQMFSSERQLRVVMSQEGSKPTAIPQELGNMCATTVSCSIQCNTTCC